MALLQRLGTSIPTANDSSYINFCKKIRRLNLPEKIKIIVWRIFNNLIPNFHNLNNKWLAGSAEPKVCEWCGEFVTWLSRLPICSGDLEYVSVKIEC